MDTEAVKDARRLLWAGVSGLVFVGLYVTHRLLQGLGPDNDDPATLTSYLTSHSGRWLASEAVLAVGLVVFVAFLSLMVTAIRHAGQAELAVAAQVSGTVFVAMGMVSSAAEAALVHVAATGDRAGVAMLFELQARVPVVLAVAMFTAAVAAAVLRASLLASWVGYAGLVAALVFLLGGLFGFSGTPEGPGSNIGIAVYVAWSVLLSAMLISRARSLVGSQTTP